MFRMTMRLQTSVLKDGEDLNGNRQSSEAGYVWANHNEFCFEHLEFDVPMKHPVQNIQKAINDVRMKFRGD